MSASAAAQVTAPTIRVLVADDHPIVASGLRHDAKGFGLEVIAEVNDPAFFQRTYDETKPDVVVLDVNFGPGRIGGLDLCKALLSKYPNARVVFYSQFDQIELITEAYRHKCLCFLTKGQPSRVLAKAIKTVMESGRFFPEDLAERITVANLNGTGSPRELLDERALQVLIMSAEGRTQEEIAEALGVSVRTAANDMSTIREKLGVTRPIEMLQIARRYHLIEL